MSIAHRNGMILELVPEISYVPSTITPIRRIRVPKGRKQNYTSKKPPGALSVTGWFYYVRTKGASKSNPLGQFRPGALTARKLGRSAPCCPGVVRVGLVFDCSWFFVVKFVLLVLLQTYVLGYTTFA